MAELLKQLAPGVYELPMRHIAIIRNGRVIVYGSTARQDIKRCRDCTHCKSGLSTYNDKLIATVCEAKPKHRYEGDSHQRYYVTNPYNKACSMFVDK